MGLIVQCLTFKNDLNYIELLSCFSFIENGTSLHLYTYSQSLQVPKGVILKDANSIIPHNELILDKDGGYSFAFNLFKYKLLYKNGGWWVDLDTFCLKQFNFNKKMVFSSKRLFDKRISVDDTILKVNAQSPLILSCITELEETFDINSSYFGSDLLQNKIFEFNYENYILTPNIFCPVPKQEYNRFFSEKGDLRLADSFAFKFWSNAWSHKNLTINDKSSFYNRLKNKHNLDDYLKKCPLEQSEVDDALDIENMTFIFPIRIDSIEQLENFELNLCIMKNAFNSPIYILEIGIIQRIFLTMDTTKIRYEFIADNSKDRDLAKHINYMVKNTNTEILCVWNSETLIDPKQIKKSFYIISNFNVQLCYPGETLCFIDDVLLYLFKRNKENFDEMRKTLSPAHYLSIPSYYAEVFLVRKIDYEHFGLENDKLHSCGFEALERIKRIEKLNGHIVFSKGPIYMLNKKNFKYLNLNHAYAVNDISEYIEVCESTSDQITERILNNPFNKI